MRRAEARIAALAASAVADVCQVGFLSLYFSSFLNLSTSRIAMPFTPNYDVPEDRRPYTFRAGRTGILMLHGFMGSPKSSRAMAEFLAGHGIAVHCPLLPGHGQLLDKMYNVSGRDWLAEAEEGLATIRQGCDEIFLMGHSMGTVLSAHLASRNDDIHGMILIAPFYDVPHKAIRLLAVLRYVMPWFYPMRFRKLHRLVRERLLDLYPDLNLDDPEIQKWMKSTTRVPTSAVDEMRKVGDMGRNLWPQLKLPALILHGRADHVARASNAEAVYRLLASEDKELCFFERAGHELMRDFDPAHRDVWQKTLAFVRGRSYASQHAFGEP
jgi:carboxylesterase